MFSLKDKVVIITGSSRGIGKATAIQMAEAGAKVVISSRKKEECDKVAKYINTNGFVASSIPCHVGKKDNIKNLVQETIKRYDKIDILVCNAATNRENVESASVSVYHKFRSNRSVVRSTGMHVRDASKTSLYA